MTRYFRNEELKLWQPCYFAVPSEYDFHVTPFPHNAVLRYRQPSHNAVLIQRGLGSTTSFKFLPQSLWMTLVTRYFKRVYYQFYFRPNSTAKIYTRRVYVNMPAYLITVYFIAFSHLRGLSQYTCFVGNQDFLKKFSATNIWHSPWSSM